MGRQYIVSNVAAHFLLIKMQPLPARGYIITV